MIPFLDILKGVTVMFVGVVIGVYTCGPAHSSEPKAPWETNDEGVVVNHNTAEGTADQRALSFCQKRGSERLTVMYSSDTITVVCRDDPQTSYTFVR